MFKYLRMNFKKINRDIRRNPKQYLVLITAVLVVGFSIFLAGTIFLVKNPLDSTPVEVTVPENYSAKDIAGVLYLSGVIDNMSAFELVSRMLNVSSKLKSGTYYLSPNMPVFSILSELEKGRSIYGSIKLVIPEGCSIYKIAKAAEKDGIMIEGDFYSLERTGITAELRLKYDFLKDVPINSLEGYLFPDTYMVPKNIKADALAKLMLDRFEAIVMPVWRSLTFKKYSLHQIMTLASIVEKEAEKDSERSLIASVFFNRLESGMPLRADPTVKYALRHPSKRVTYEDLKVNSPYNTYLNGGLPPGPICNPGLKSILAVMYPARTDYFYFVSNGNGDGTHTFSKTWDQHAKAVERYRKLR